MILSYLFALIVIAHIILLAISFRGGAGIERWLVHALLLGLIYDNLILAISSHFSFESWYYGASWLRYVVHVLVIPPLVLVALRLLQNVGVIWAGSRVAFSAGLLFAVAGISFGLVTEIAGLELVRESLWEHIRYVNFHASPPLATIATNILVLVLASILWRRAAWPWLFAAALFILLVNGILAGSEWGVIAGNLTEVAFALAWVMTLDRFSKTPIDNNHLPDA